MKMRFIGRSAVVVSIFTAVCLAQAAPTERVAAVLKISSIHKLIADVGDKNFIIL